MNILIAGLAKSGTTMLFSRVLQALGSDNVETYFEPDQREQLTAILSKGADINTLTKVLIGRVKPEDRVLSEFDKHVVIYRDPRDQFVSMLLYLFYDFQISGDQEGYQQCFELLQRKQRDPDGVSAITLYSEVASCVGRAPVAVFSNLHQVQSNYIETFDPRKARYENLVDGQWSELEDYLGLSLVSEATVPEQYSRVVRSKAYGDWRQWLNRDDIAYVNEHWGKSILALGYVLEEAAQNPVISPETTTDYVRQFDPRRNQLPE